MKAGLIDECGNVLVTRKMKIAAIEDSETLAWTLAQMAQDLAADGGVPIGEIASVGVGVPGAVEIHTGMVLYTCNLPLRNVPLRRLFHRYLNLPLYVENMVSEDTSEFVKEHLESCPACRAELEKLREPVEVQTEPQPDMDAAPLKRLKKALLMKKVQTILCTAAVLLALMLSVISFLTAPEYFAYSPELVTVTEEANGAVTLSFGNEVTNYKLQQITDPEDRNTVYHLEVWTSAWDRAFHRPGVQAVTAAPESGKPLLVYFTQFINGHAESSSDSSVCIYGTAPDSGGWVALAGLSLGYWLLFNIALFLILIGVWFKLRRKEKSRRWVERLLPIPIAYGLGHLCVMGFRTASCSEWRDFQLILAVGVLFYCAMLLALSIFYNVKELRGIKREGENE